MATDSDLQLDGVLSNINADEKIVSNLVGLLEFNISSLGNANPEVRISNLTAVNHMASSRTVECPVN